MKTTLHKFEIYTLGIGYYNEKKGQTKKTSVVIEHENDMVLST